MNDVTVRCWHCGHYVNFKMTLQKEEALYKKITKNKAVCPKCRDIGLGNRVVFISDGKTLIYPGKLYQCTHGHVTSISPFVNGFLNLKYGPLSDNSTNVEGTLEELSDLIDSKEIVCHHEVDGTPCGQELKAIDSYTLSYPSTPGIKTKVRVGDLWDKHNIEPVRNGRYTQDGYDVSKTEVANKERLREMRKRNVPENKIPGKIVNSPTKNVYRKRQK